MGWGAIKVLRGVSIPLVIPSLHVPFRSGIDGLKMVGRRVKVWWPMDQAYYIGTVQAYNLAEVGAAWFRVWKLLDMEVRISK